MDVKVNTIYKHFKGDLYLVEDIGYDCDTLEKVVIYKALYNDCRIYVRKYNDFISTVDKVKYPNIKQEYRFEIYKIDSIKEK